jgi:ketosteroid isomerase-like protein
LGFSDGLPLGWQRWRATSKIGYYPIFDREPGGDTVTQVDLTKSVYEPAEIESIVREWFRTYSDKDFDAHNALIHPDAVVVYPEMAFVDPELSAGKAFLEKTLEKDEANFIDLRQTITDLWVVGNTAFVEGYFSGSKLGGTIVEEAQGSEMKLRFLDRIEIEDRKVKLIYAYYDTALLYQIQLGLEGPTKANPIPPWMLSMKS